MNATITIGTAKDGATARWILSGDEVRRCELMSCRGRRSDFRASRLAVARALEGRDVHDTVVSSARCQGRAVAVAASRGTRVGVALEREGSIQLHAARADLTPFELRLAAHMDPTILWSAKEAVWKALGLDASLPLGEIELSPEASGQLVGAYVRGVFLPLHVRLSEPWTGFFMTTVWMSGGTA